MSRRIDTGALEDMIADIDFSKVNTWILGFFGILGTFGGVGSLLASFKSRSLKIALEAVKISNEALKTELQAAGERSERLERDRNEYREKLHESHNLNQALVVENTELKVRTDFTPVMNFQKAWYEEQAKINQKTLEVLVRVAGVLDRIEPKLVA